MILLGKLFMTELKQGKGRTAEKFQFEGKRCSSCLREDFPSRSVLHSSKSGYSLAAVLDQRYFSLDIYIPTQQRHHICLNNGLDCRIQGKEDVKRKKSFFHKCFAPFSTTKYPQNDVFRTYFKSQGGLPIGK